MEFKQLKMQKEFIPYEQALELKELGFDKECFGFYTLEGTYLPNSTMLNSVTYGCIAPLYQQVFRWFREKHRLYHDIKMFGDWDKPQYIYIVSGKTIGIGNPAKMYYYEDKDSYEEAELECLKKLIQLLKFH